MSVFARTLSFGGNRTRHRWIVYVGFKGKWGDYLRIVRLDTATRDVTGGWTLIKGPRPPREDDLHDRECSR